MDNHDAKYSSSAVALAFLGGAVAGAVVGLLLAPKPGEDTRVALKGYARKAEENLLEKAKEARVALDESIERGKHFLAEKAGDVEAAAKAGREAMKEKIDTCCN
jgi:gas vesicle protein